MKRPVKALSILLCLMAAPALAQVSNKGGPMGFGADHQQDNAKDHTHLLEGHVEMQQDNARLRCDQIKFFSAAPNGNEQSSGWGAIIRFEADGNIYYVVDDETVKADHAVYTKDNDTIIFTGEVIISQGQNVEVGNKLIYNKATGLMTMDANPINNAAQGRVKGVVYPDKKTDNSPAKPVATTPPKP